MSGTTPVPFVYLALLRSSSAASHRRVVKELHRPAGPVFPGDLLEPSVKVLSDDVSPERLGHRVGLILGDFPAPTESLKTVHGEVLTGARSPAEIADNAAQFAAELPVELWSELLH
jgi:hypothetical protein